MTDFVDKITFADALEAAQCAHWEMVDEYLQTPPPAEDVKWAEEKGLDDSDENARDFAASILEKSGTPIEGTLREKIEKMIANDEHFYVQFRLAFALFARGDRSLLVINRMNAALKDPEVAPIAQAYIDSIDVSR